MTNNTPPHNLLVVAPNWVGDTVMAQTLFILLKQINPQQSIDVLAPAWTQALLAYMPEVRRTWLSPFKHGELHWRKRRILAKQLQTEEYDQVIILPNSFKSALIPFWSRIPVRTGYSREGRACLLTDARPYQTPRSPTVERFARLGLAKAASLPKTLPYPRLQTTETAVQQTCADLQLSLQARQPILALCPGAEYGPAKRWPAEYFAQVAITQHKAGWAVWLFGSPKETAIGREIQEKSGHCCVNLIGKSSLAQAIDLLSLATAVVANDSGLMHVACALNKPVAALYGSTPPSVAPPLSHKAKTFYNHLPCSPCFKRQCPLEHFNCLRKLYPAQVLDWLVHLKITEGAT